ncbi:MAG: hypothetical protein C0613_15110 [Desulfobulbaceae bacterium]|nr:MAG: hypothetical protein C0613_15110 [Desulfobulbaceae bacterium]
METPISNICLRLFFSQSLISYEMTYFWTDTILPDFFGATKIKSSHMLDMLRGLFSMLLKLEQVSERSETPKYLIIQDTL